MESADYNTVHTVNMFFVKLTHDCKFSRLLNPFVFFGYYKFRVFETLATPARTLSISGLKSRVLKLTFLT